MRIKHLIAAVLAFLMVCAAVVDPIAGEIFPAALVEESDQTPENGEPEPADGTQTETQPPEPVYEFADSDTFCEARGDVDRDGSVTAADARLALRFAVQLETPEEEDVRRGDYNLSSTLDAADARLILRVAVGLEITPRHVSAGNVTMEEATCLSSGKVGKRCIFCNRFYDVGVLPPMEHKSAGWTIEKNATCTEEGFMKQVCIYCGVEISSVVTPKRPHVWDEEHPTYIEKEPDCTRVQTVEYTCMICGAKKTGSNKIYKNHDYVWVETLAPTCTEQGLQVKQCKRCGKASPNGDIQLLPSLGGHTPVWIVQSEPNASLPGHRINRCTKCQTVLAEEDILFEPGEHRYDMSAPIFLDEEPDCTALQEVEYVCLDCGEHRQSLRLPSKAHDNVRLQTLAPTCTEAGEEADHCSLCGKETNQKELKALGHRYEWITTIEATCTEAGEEIRRCTRCGIEDGTRQVKALGHQYEWITTIEATCTEAGEELRRCTRCGIEDETREVPKLNHYYEWVEILAPTCTEEGREEEICIHCGASSGAIRVTANLGGEHTPRWFILELPGETTPGKMIYRCTRCQVILDEREIPPTGKP